MHFKLINNAASQSGQQMGSHVLQKVVGEVAIYENSDLVLSEWHRHPKSQFPIFMHFSYKV